MGKQRSSPRVGQKAFVLDLNRCTGCDACRIACKIENDLPAAMSWREVVTFNQRRIPGIPLFSLSLACNHCLDAPCKEKCPALAYRKDPETGAVTIRANLCMGCKYCQWVCPYDAPKFNPSTGVMEKCTFCAHRIETGLEPACTTSCPTGALGFADYSAKDGGNGVPGFWRGKIRPAIAIIPLRRGMRPPETHRSAGANEPVASLVRTPSAQPRRVSLWSEWPLLVFSLAAPILVALFHSWVIARLEVPLVSFAMAGVSAMAVSTSHLGKRHRFYRALLNLKGSWVSREVALFSAFFFGALYCLALAPDEGVVARVVAAVGFLALFAMDKVYQLETNRARSGLHSASVLLTGIYLVGLFTMHPLFFFPLALVKLVLYLLRKLAHLRRRARSWKTLFAVRILAGYIAPGVLWLSTGPAHYELIVASVLIGELVDRAEFYLELDFTRPTTKAAADLETLIASRSTLDLGRS